ncbi:AAC(3)-I family aminoglycoside N-acetyltransferase [Maricaulaceae bacterium MS644]
MARPVTVRRLGVDDVAQMRLLNAVFAAAFEDPEPYASAPPPDAYLSAWLAKPHVIALAAFEDEAVIGGLVAYVLDKFEQARAEIYIYDIAVGESHRRRGVATSLIAALRPLARKVGASVIFVQADPEDPPAIALYEKLGDRAEVVHFDIAAACD